MSNSAPNTTAVPTAPREAALRELKAIFEEHRQMSWLLGGLMIISILGALPAWVAVGMKVNLMWGALAFAGCLVVFFAALGAFLVRAAKKDAKATAAVREVEQRHGLTQQESLDLIWPEGSRLSESDSAAFFKPFINTVWGKDAYDQTAERERQAILKKYNLVDKSASLPSPVFLSYFACGYCHKPVVFERAKPKIVCPKCDRKLQLRSLIKCPVCQGRPELVEELVGGVAGEIVGTALMGAVGSMVGKAMAGQMGSVYACTQCSHRFGIELLEETDIQKSG